MSVRPPILRIAASAPAVVARGVPFNVTVDYESEVSRWLTVLVARVSNCPINPSLLLARTAATIARWATVHGVGSTGATVRLDQPGTYLICGYLDERLLPAASPLVVHAATVVVPGPRILSKNCGDVGGRRHVRGVSARNVTCAEARNVARRWDRARRAPRRAGAYRCFWRSGVVTCAAGAKRVQFGFGRR